MSNLQNLAAGYEAQFDKSDEYRMEVWCPFWPFLHLGEWNGTSHLDWILNSLLLSKMFQCERIFTFLWFVFLQNFDWNYRLLVETYRLLMKRSPQMAWLTEHMRPLLCQNSFRLQRGFRTGPAACGRKPVFGKKYCVLVCLRPLCRSQINILIGGRSHVNTIDQWASSRLSEMISSVELGDGIQLERRNEVWRWRTTTKGTSEIRAYGVGFVLIVNIEVSNVRQKL